MELKDKLDEMGKAFDAFKAANDQKLKEIEKHGQASASIIEKVEKANEHMDRLEKQIEEIKTALNRTGGAGALKGDDEKKAIEYKRAINAFMRKGEAVPHELNVWAKQKTIELAGGQFEEKSMSVQSDEDGGFFVSPELSSEISKVVFESSPIRQLASVQSLSTDSLEILYDGDEPESGWVGETSARSSTATPKIKKIIIPVNELYANPPVTQKLLDDAAVNVEAWLQGKVSDKFARDEATAFVKGDGNGKPKGILAYATGTGFNQIERVETAANNALAGDDFIKVQSALKEPYQMNATWLINRTLVGVVRMLKDVNTGQYIWQPGLTAGQPNTLLGRPVMFAPDLLSAVTQNTDGLAIYGDFRAGYQIVDRIGVRVLRDPYSNKPFIHFFTTKRVGGGVKLFECIKTLKQKN
jgi:HK97 family phage major capsid protein